MIKIPWFGFWILDKKCSKNCQSAALALGFWVVDFIHRLQHHSSSASHLFTSEQRINRLPAAGRCWNCLDWRKILEVSPFDCLAPWLAADHKWPPTRSTSLSLVSCSRALVLIPPQPLLISSLQEVVVFGPPVEQSMLAPLSELGFYYCFISSIFYLWRGGNNFI